MGQNGMRQRCFIGFFGITRALSWTIESIERNVFEPLDDAGIDQVRAAHFNRPEFINAPRGGEENVPFEIGDLGRLKLDSHIVEPQSEAKIADYTSTVMELPQLEEDDPGGTTRRNAIYQLYSLKGLAWLFNQMDPLSYDMVMLLRPDLRYLDPMPVKKLLAQIKPKNGSTTSGVELVRRGFRSPADIVTPGWHKWGGLNDRFSIGTTKAAKVYMNRIDCLKDFCASKASFQTEQLLQFAIAKAGLRTADTWVRADRVRSNGRVETRDLHRKEPLTASMARPLHRLLQI